MEKIKELKKIIIDLKMKLIKNKIPIGTCPYTYYANVPRRFKCDIGCEKCRKYFLQDIEIVIKREVEKL